MGMKALLRQLSLRIIWSWRFSPPQRAYPPKRPSLHKRAGLQKRAKTPMKLRRSKKIFKKQNAQRKRRKTLTRRALRIWTLRSLMPSSTLVWTSPAIRLPL